MKLTILINDRVVLDKEIQTRKIWGESHALGFTGELIVEEKLNGLGINNIKLPNNSPADFLLTDNNKLVEVKAAGKGFTKVKDVRYTSYAFKVEHKIPDYFIVWLADGNRFYVLYCKDIKLGVNRVYPTAAKWKAAEGNWEILT